MTGVLKHWSKTKKGGKEIPKGGNHNRGRTRQPQGQVIENGGPLETHGSYVVKFLSQGEGGRDPGEKLGNIQGKQKKTAR